MIINTLWHDFFWVNFSAFFGHFTFCTIIAFGTFQWLWLFSFIDISVFVTHMFLWKVSYSDISMFAKIVVVTFQFFGHFSFVWHFNSFQHFSSSDILVFLTFQFLWNLILWDIAFWNLIFVVFILGTLNIFLKKKKNYKN